MLPGLQMLDPCELVQCNILSSIVKGFAGGKAGRIEDYHSSFCNEECNQHHVIVYLEHCLHHGHFIGEKELSKLFAHENSKIRKIALLLYCKHFPSSELPDALLEDPSNRIRELFLSVRIESDASSLLQQMDDDNWNVRMTALQKLSTFVNNPRFQQGALKVVCNAMNDRELPIRILASKMLGMFKGISDNIIERFLDKVVVDSVDEELCGALVYGIEDEYSDVRRNTMETLCELATPGTISRIFDFLVDSMNDDDDELREFCTRCLLVLSERYALNVEWEIVLQICGGLEERGNELRGNILALLSNLRYDDLSILDVLMTQLEKKIDVKKIFECIRRMVSGNVELFMKELKRFHPCDIDPNDDCCIARLVVLRELKRRYPGLSLDKETESGFLLLEIIGQRRTDEKHLKGHEFFRNIFCQFLEERICGERTEKDYRRIFSGECGCMDESYGFICYLYNGTVQLLNRGKNVILRRIPHLFSNTNFDASIVEDLDDFLQYVRALDLRKIGFCGYLIDVQQNLVVRRGMPMRFRIGVSPVEMLSEDVSVIIESRDGTFLKFLAEEEINVCIFEESISFVDCYVIRIIGNERIRLSQMKRMTITRE